MMHSFPMIQSLDCLQVQPIVSKKIMKIIARLPRLQKLSFTGDGNTGDGLLAEIVKATGLTCLHIHSAVVSLHYRVYN